MKTPEPPTLDLQDLAILLSVGRSHKFRLDIIHDAVELIGLFNQDLVFQSRFTRLQDIGLIAKAKEPFGFEGYLSLTKKGSDAIKRMNQLMSKMSMASSSLTPFM